MANRNLLVLVLLCAMVAASAATTYTAGGSGGWSLSNTGNIDSIYANPGDYVAFYYEQYQHTVTMVPQDAFYSCDSSSPYATYTSGSDIVSLPTEGNFYFICSKEGHCEAGMKIAVYVGQ